MSSILDALEKLEARRAAGDAPAPARPTRRPGGVLLAAAVAAFVAGSAITIAWVRPRPDSAPASEPPGQPAPAAPEPVVAAVPVAPAAASPAPAAMPPPPSEPASAARGTPRAAEKPWGEVVTPPARRFVAEPIGASPAEPPPAPVRRGFEAARAPAAPATRPPEVALATTRDAERPASRARPAGAPPVRVSLLLYSSVPARRSVALTIGEAGLVTLREGETAAGVSVVQILPDEVDLAWQGEAFTVPARQ